jgi:hypothetical protein
VVDPDGLHLAEPVMAHNEFRMRLYVKPLMGDDPIEGHVTVGAKTWGANA